MMGDHSLDAFDRGRRAGLQLEACPYKRLNRIRDNHCARGAKADTPAAGLAPNP